MPKKVVKMVKLQVPAGKATPAPPVGPALGQAGVNIIDGTVKYLGQSIVIGLLRLIFNRLDHFTLTCGTLEIITCGITDTAVSRRLQTV